MSSNGSTTARRRRWLPWALAGLLAFAVVLALSLAYLVRGERWTDATSRTPMELVRYADRRLIGHPNLQRVLSPMLDAIRRNQVREPPPNLPSLGKGQQPHALAHAGYDAAGNPRPLARPVVTTVVTPASVAVSDVKGLVAAMSSAPPGSVIELAPGTYSVSQTLSTGMAGLPAKPIVMRAAKPGSVELVVTAVVGVWVTQPYWVFENLDWRGACANHDACEHAFHVVGAARATVILNNRMRDFNAHLKVNGVNGVWPDGGLLQFSTLSNDSPRRTDAPVSAIDLVGANAWVIADNRVERFAKDGGNQTSYGMCLKGAGDRVRAERNLVVCTPEQRATPGLRVGISLGCGATGRAFCRDGRCDAEMSNGVVANNVVAHCSDFGIDLHRAQASLVAHNTLINTEGIDARQSTTRAIVVGNLVEGTIRARDGARVDANANAVARTLDTVLAMPDALDLHWLESSDQTRATPETERDFCGNLRPPISPPGATLQPRCDTPH